MHDNNIMVTTGDMLRQAFSNCVLVLFVVLVAYISPITDSMKMHAWAL